MIEPKCDILNSDLLSDLKNDPLKVPEESNQLLESLSYGHSNSYSFLLSKTGSDPFPVWNPGLLNQDITTWKFPYRVYNTLYIIYCIMVIYDIAYSIVYIDYII